MPNTSPSKSAVTGAMIAGIVERFIGDVYVYGAEGPNTFDCSGLVQYTFGKAGIKLPRTAEAQYAATTPITSGQLLPGDLVFSAGSDGTTSHPGHVGIYVGRPDGTPTVVEAPHTGALVRYTPLSKFDASGYRRVSGVSNSGVTDAGYHIPGVGEVPDLGDVAGGLGSVASGILDIPQDIIGFFGKATDDLTSLGKFFWAFTQPATWVRIGAGYLGTICLLAGIVFLIMAGVQSS